MPILKYISKQPWKIIFETPIDDVPISEDLPHACTAMYQPDTGTRDEVMYKKPSVMSPSYNPSSLTQLAKAQKFPASKTIRHSTTVYQIWLTD